MPHNAMSFDQLKAIAEKYTSVVVKESATGRMLFTVYGGRLLGIFPRADGPNPLWVHAGLEESLRTGQWMTGGERLWIAPERNFFYENPRDFEGVHVPAEIDPGEYAATGELTFESMFSLLDYHTNEAIDGSVMRREFTPVDDPYATGLPFAGVEIQDSITVPREGVKMCAWSLAQLYTCGPQMPGTALFPAKTGSSVLSYFNPIPADRAQVLDNYARFRIDAEVIYKLAIRPEDMLFENPVKAVYLTPSPDASAWLAVVKRSNDMPRSQDDCVDVARDNPEGPRGAIQSYNSGPSSAGDSDVMRFGEIEIQLCKGVLNNGKTVSAATHELLAYQGTREQMLEFARTALKLTAAPKLY